jgi:ketosteroid isomerase-like protein
MTEVDDTTRILEANEAFYSAFNRKDAEAMEAVWSSRDDVSCLHPGWNVLRGRDAVLDSWRSILSNPQQPRIVVGGAEVTLLGDVAFVVCREMVAGSPLVATNIYALEDGAWKLVHHQSGPVSSLS